MYDDAAGEHAGTHERGHCRPRPLGEAREAANTVPGGASAPQLHGTKVSVRARTFG